MIDQVLRLPLPALILAGVFYAGLLALLLPVPRAMLCERIRMPSPSTHSYLGALDSLRGLAALWVASFHIWQWTRPAFDTVYEAAPVIAYGNLGVPVFVVLSGFLITRSLIFVTDLDGLKRYALRRFLRVYPLYATTVVAGILIFWPELGSAPLQRVIAELLMFRSLGYAQFLNPQSWSLYVEVLFYMLAPVLVLTVRGNPMPWLLALLAVFALGDAGTVREVQLWKYFIFGALACFFFLRHADRLPRWAGGTLFALGLGLFLFCFRMDLFILFFQRLNRVLPLGVAPSYGTPFGLSVALIITGSITCPAINRWLSLGPLRYLATISYSLFLWHSFLITLCFPVRFDGQGSVLISGPFEPLPGWGYGLVLLPALFALSTASFVLIERPVLLLRPRTKAGA